MGVFFCEGCDCHRDSDIDGFYETVGEEGIIVTRCDRCLEGLDDVSTDLYNIISEPYQEIEDEES
jgi:hypothetical protein